MNLSHALGEEAHEHSHEEHGIRVLKSFSLGGDAYMYLSVRDQGHVLGQPFVVETRLSCVGEVEDIKELEVVDSYSVCNMLPDSVVINTKATAVGMIVKSADIDRYDRDIASGLESPDIQCYEQNEMLKFSLKNLCKKSD